ncbi:hypothetical protein, partial [Rhizobium leguminosarum]
TVAMAAPLTEEDVCGCAEFSIINPALWDIGSVTLRPEAYFLDHIPDASSLRRQEAHQQIRGWQIHRDRPGELRRRVEALFCDRPHPYGPVAVKLTDATPRSSMFGS